MGLGTTIGYHSQLLGRAAACISGDVHRASSPGHQAAAPTSPRLGSDTVLMRLGGAARNSVELALLPIVGESQPLQPDVTPDARTEQDPEADRGQQPGWERPTGCHDRPEDRDIQ